MQYSNIKYPGRVVADLLCCAGTSQTVPAESEQAARCSKPVVSQQPRILEFCLDYLYLITATPVNLSTIKISLCS